MTIGLARADVEQFRDLLSLRLGLAFDDGRTEELADLLGERLRDTGCGEAGMYLSRLRSPDAARRELRVLAGHLTVRETYFFRGPDHFRAFADVVLPACARAAWERRELRILSAGAATGEEAYTLAILVREHLRDFDSWRISILGIDVSAEALERARKGRYSRWSLRQTPPETLRRYFEPVDGEHLIDSRLREMVLFEERNLVEEDPAFWRPGAFDVIFCRNVFIYLSREAIQPVVARFSGSLQAGGFLFLGHSETLRGLTHQFHLIHTNDTFYYQRHDREPATALRRGIVAEPPASLPPDSPIEEDASWIDAIRRATERVSRLAEGPRPGDVRTEEGPAADARRSGTPASGTAHGGLAHAIDLFRQERFEEAALTLKNLPSGAAADPDALLLHAAALTNRGEGAEAERLCRQVLALDELNAGAHHLLALCRAAAGDLDATLHHARSAVYLDPMFAMPRLHLGRLARRAGELDTARRELTDALHLLALEDSSRILLFGGGFHRSALIQLCRAELLACGDA